VATCVADEAAALQDHRAKTADLQATRDWATQLEDESRRRAEQAAQRLREQQPEATHRIQQIEMSHRYAMEQRAFLAEARLPQAGGQIGSNVIQFDKPPDYDKIAGAALTTTFQVEFKAANATTMEDINAMVLSDHSVEDQARAILCAAAGNMSSPPVRSQVGACSR
jgi:hypothetical protein